MRCSIILVSIVLMSVGLVHHACATERVAPTAVEFNGVRLGDAAAKIAEQRRSGACRGRGSSLSECVIHDTYGVAFRIHDGHVISVVAAYGSVKAAKLPFGLRLGADVVETLGRTFPGAGGQAFVVPGKSGVVIVKLIREPGAEYDFELRLRYDIAGRLVSVEYKDVV